jgi:hypothetical protein
VEIKQDSSKTLSTRSSTQILDFFGDIGGFKEALLLILFFFGEYFSAKLFISKVAEDLYVTKKRGNSEEYIDRS